IAMARASVRKFSTLPTGIHSIFGWNSPSRYACGRGLTVLRASWKRAPNRDTTQLVYEGGRRGGEPRTYFVGIVRLVSLPNSIWRLLVYALRSAVRSRRGVRLIRTKPAGG